MSDSTQEIQRIVLDPAENEKFFVRMGLSWNPTSPISLRWADMDVSAFVFGPSGRLIDSVWSGKRASHDYSIRHFGDNTTGHGEGDDEILRVNLKRVSNRTATIVLMVSSHTGQPFAKVRNCQYRLVKLADEVETELANRDLTDDCTVITAVVIRRQGEQWAVDVANTPGNAHGNPALAKLAKQAIA